MTKTLSEQLCEICGIKPKTIPCPHKGCRNHITHPCEVCNNRRFIEVYPNFEQPENFVKLMELPLAEANITVFLITVLKKINEWEHVPWNRESYLELLLLVIQESAISQKWQGSIKQSIHDYDGWVWG